MEPKPEHKVFNRITKRTIIVRCNRKRLMAKVSGQKPMRDNTPVTPNPYTIQTFPPKKKKKGRKK